jgi:hypothetical protein
MSRSRRLILTIIAGVILSCLGAFAIYRQMEAVASACVAGIMAILSTYIWGETRRPSDKDQPDQNPQP